MKKIYAKFTKERAWKFQIETAIYEKEDGEKIVEKRPLNPEAGKHMERMYDNYLFFRDTGLYLECEKKEGSLWFPFVKGKSLYDDLLQAVENKKRSKVEKILEEYIGIIQNAYKERVPFEQTPEFVRIFGEAGEIQGLDAASRADIDFTMDNLIRTEDGIRLLDYEWIFDFPIPLKFLLFRGAFAVWTKHGQTLKMMMDKKEFFHFFDISSEERKCFQRMNDHFMEFVEGGEDSYQKLLRNYQKQDVKLWKVENEEQDFPMVFWGRGGQFFPERSEVFECKDQENIRIEVEVSHYAETDCIRMDPTNFPSVIRVKRLEVEDEKYVRKLSQEEFFTNSTDTSESDWIFLTSDPQIMIPIPQKCTWKKVILEYQVLHTHLEQLEEIISILRKSDQKIIGKWQDKVKEKTELAEGQAKLLNESAHKLVEYEQTIQLLKDKLAYIEGTKAYQYLLKKKVAQIHLWDEIQ